MNPAASECSDDEGWYAARGIGGLMPLAAAGYCGCWLEEDDMIRGRRGKGGGKEEWG